MAVTLDVAGDEDFSPDGGRAVELDDPQVGGAIAAQCRLIERFVFELDALVLARSDARGVAVGEPAGIQRLTNRFGQILAGRTGRRIEFDEIHARRQIGHFPRRPGGFGGTAAGRQLTATGMGRQGPRQREVGLVEGELSAIGHGGMEGDFEPAGLRDADLELAFFEVRESHWPAHEEVQKAGGLNRHVKWGRFGRHPQPADPGLDPTHAKLVWIVVGHLGIGGGVPTQPDTLFERFEEDRRPHAARPVQALGQAKDERQFLAPRQLDRGLALPQPIKLLAVEMGQIAGKAFGPHDHVDRLGRQLGQADERDRTVAAWQPFGAGFALGRYFDVELGDRLAIGIDHL